MVGSGRGVLQAALALGMALAVWSDCAAGVTGVRAWWRGTPHEICMDHRLVSGLDAAMEACDPTPIAVLLPHLSSSAARSLGSAVELFLSGRYGAARAVLGRMEVLPDGELGERAKMLGDLASSWAQWVEALRLVEGSDEELELRVPQGQESWGRKVLPLVRGWFRAYAAISPWPVHKPIRITFLPSTDALSMLMRADKKALERSGTVASTVLRHLLLLSPSATPGGYFWPRVLCHEMVHWLFLGAPRGDVPLLLEEGVATWLEEYGATGRARELSVQDRMLLALAPSGMAAAAEQSKSSFYQGDSPSTVRMMFLLAWWKVRSDAGSSSPEEYLRRLAEQLPAIWEVRTQEIQGLLWHAREVTNAARHPLPRDAQYAVAAAYYPELLPERLSKGLEEARRPLLLADLLWGRRHRGPAARLLSGLPEVLLMTPELFWRLHRLKKEMGGELRLPALTELVPLLFPEDTGVLHTMACSGASGGPVAIWQLSLADAAWLTNPFARESLLVLDDENGHADSEEFP